MNSKLKSIAILGCCALFLACSHATAAECSDSFFEGNTRTEIDNLAITVGNNVDTYNRIKGKTDMSSLGQMSMLCGPGNYVAAATINGIKIRRDAWAACPKTSGTTKPGTYAYFNPCINSWVLV